MREFPRTIELPDAFNTSIGEIVVGYAALEQRLRDIVYECAGIDHKKGRVLQIARRLQNYPELIRELLLAQDKDIDLGVPDGWPTSLKDMLKEAEEHRNALAHGIWVKMPEHQYPVLQIVDKTWKPKDGKKVLAKIKPTGWVMGDEFLPTVLDYIKVALVVVDDFHKQVRSILAAG